MERQQSSEPIRSSRILRGVTKLGELIASGGLGRREENLTPEITDSLDEADRDLREGKTHDLREVMADLETEDPQSQ